MNLFIRKLVLSFLSTKLWLMIFLLKYYLMWTSPAFSSISSYSLPHWRRSIQHNTAFLHIRHGFFQVVIAFFQLTRCYKYFEFRNAHFGFDCTHHNFVFVDFNAGFAVKFYLSSAKYCFFLRHFAAVFIIFVRAFCI